MAAVQLGEMTPFAKEMLALGRNEQPERLWRAWWGGEIDDETLREWILPTWQLAEFPARYLRHRDWLDMFGATGFLSDGADEAPDPLTVYRGAEPCGMRGFSWSWEPQRAEWFACRLALAGRPASVYEVTLRRDLLLAVIGGVEGRGEREVLVNPRRLRGRYTPRELYRIEYRDGEYQTELATEKPKPGDCFHYAGRRMLAEPEDTSARVVHGTYEAFPGHRDIHGLFEKDGLVWDWQTHGRAGSRSRFKVTSTTPRAVPRDEFHRTRKTETRRSFTRKQMMQAMLDTGHWGPWFSDEEAS
jgi:hypothetical protein